jgi:transcriptional regulator with XRE-family HTH domain
MIRNGSYIVIRFGSMNMISAPQIRAARGLLGWSQVQLAQAAGLSEPTIKRIEGGKVPVSDEARAAIRAALEAAGALFVDANGHGPGVRLRDRPTATAVEQS